MLADRFRQDRVLKEQYVFRRVYVPGAVSRMYLWHGATNYVELNPHVVPAHIFRVHRRVRTERDFDYYT